MFTKEELKILQYGVGINTDCLYASIILTRMGLTYNDENIQFVLDKKPTWDMYLSVDELERFQEYRILYHKIERLMEESEIN